MKRIAATAIALLPLLLPPSGAAQGMPQPRCMRDAEGELYCAQWDMGVAVRSGEGDIVCAPGACVRASDVNPDWFCSSEEGGWANVTPEGPVCQGGCQSPDQGSCSLADNIDDNDE
jgi:hypothetical protein